MQKRVQIGVYAKRNEDGGFGVAYPIYQEIEAREGTPPLEPPYEEVAEMFFKIMKKAKIIKRRKEL